MSLNFGKGGLTFGGKKQDPGKALNLAKAPDPLASVEYTGNVEKDSANELSAMDQAYRDRAKQEAKRFKNATDSEFWFAVCFHTREYKDAFLEEINATRIGDKYIDGHALARLLGITLDADSDSAT